MQRNGRVVQLAKTWMEAMRRQKDFGDKSYGWPGTIGVEMGSEAINRIPRKWKKQKRIKTKREPKK